MACYCKGLLCASEEEFVGPLRLKLARELRNAGYAAEAKGEIEAVMATATMFGPENDAVDEHVFAARCGDDRHHFRFIVSPEDAGQMQDLRAFTRDLMGQAARDLGTELDWVAVDH